MTAYHEAVIASAITTEEVWRANHSAHAGFITRETVRSDDGAVIALRCPLCRSCFVAGTIVKVEALNDHS
jgi:hypothetical protein